MSSGKQIIENPVETIADSGIMWALIAVGRAESFSGVIFENLAPVSELDACLLNQKKEVRQ